MSMENILTRIYPIADHAPALGTLLFAMGIGNSFFPPIPLEAAVVFAGYLAATGHGSLAVIMAAATAGTILGNIGLYALSRSYGDRILTNRFFGRFIRRSYYDRMARWFHSYGAGALLLGKFIPGMHFCAVVCGGVLKLRAGRAVGAIVVSNVLMIAAVAYAGYIARGNWRRALAVVNSAGIAGALAVAALAAAAVMAYRKYRRSK